MLIIPPSLPPSLPPPPSLQPHLFTSRESCDWAIRARRDMLVSAETCFLQSLTLEGTKHAEPWIYSLMLGKIRYKLERPVTQTLQHLLTVRPPMEIQSWCGAGLFVLDHCFTWVIGGLSLIEIRLFASLNTE